MNAVIYARFSDHTQREESIEGQIRVCNEFAKQHNLTVIDKYIDRATTGRNDDRPSFQKMMCDSRKRTFDVVLVYQLDRFSRNRYDSAINKSILKKNGVKVMSARENITDDANGILMEGILESIAEYYSVELSQKIHRGQEENALKGKNNGGSILLGYKIGEDQRLEIDPKTAPMVLEIFRRYAAGESKKEIADSLNERGFTTRKGKPFTMSSFNTMFANRKYIGEYRYRDIVIPNGVPALISNDLFEAVQKRVLVNKRAPGRTKAEVDYLLSCKLFCGTCGTMMVGDNGTSKTGAVYYYYKCGSAKRKKGCKKKAVRKEWIEKIVLQIVQSYILQDEVIQKIAKMVVENLKKENPAISMLQEQKKELEKKHSNIMKAIEDGMYHPSLQNRIKELEEQIDKINFSLAKEKIQTPSFTEEEIIEWMNHFKEMDLDSVECQHQLIDCFVHKIYLYDDRLVLLFRADNSPIEISYEMVQSSDFSPSVSPNKAGSLVFPALFFLL
jgi:site-specific DNA recombinase